MIKLKSKKCICIGFICFSFFSETFGFYVTKKKCLYTCIQQQGNLKVVARQTLGQHNSSNPEAIAYDYCLNP